MSKKLIDFPEIKQAAHVLDRNDPKEQNMNEAPIDKTTPVCC